MLWGEHGFSGHTGFKNRHDGIGLFVGPARETRLYATGEGAYDHNGFAVSIDGTRAIVGAPGSDGRAGSARIYELDTTGLTCGRDEWCEVATLRAPAGGSGGNFGYSISIDGNRAVVGATGDADRGTGAGAVYVFERAAGNTPGDTATWHQSAKLTASDGETYDFFGSAVSVDGETILAGAQFKDLTNGAAYVFALAADGSCAQTAGWCETRLVAVDATEHANFGNAVSLDGDTAVIGAYRDSAGAENAGVAYLFQLDREGTICGAGEWCQDVLPVSEIAPFAYFGWSVSIDGDWLLVGGTGDSAHGSRSGAAYIYRRNFDASLCDSTWCDSGRLTAPDGSAGAYFGGSVAVDGDRALVGAFGAFGDSGGSGSAYLCDLAGSGTSPRGDERCQQRIVPRDAGPRDRYGWSVALEGNTALVGAVGDDDQGPSAGSAYVHALSSRIRD